MSRNFGLGSRDMDFAGKLAAANFYPSYGSSALVARRWALFVLYLRESTEIRRMENITRDVVVEYGLHLKVRCETGALSRHSVVCYMSAVNTILAIGRGDNLLRVSPVRDLQLSRSLKAEKIDRGARFSWDLCCKLGAANKTLCKLHRSWGLRFEEAAKLDARKALAEVLSTEKITIAAGTKGGKARTVVLREGALQIDVLREAADLQGDQKSLIPSDLKYAVFASRAHNKAYHHGVRFHDARHAFCQALYLRLTGWKSPIALSLSKKKHLKFTMLEHDLSEVEYRSIDQNARKTIAREMGHERVSVTTSYLG
jgi:hypothetical protein